MTTPMLMIQPHTPYPKILPKQRKFTQPVKNGTLALTILTEEQYKNHQYAIKQLEGFFAAIVKKSQNFKKP